MRVARKQSNAATTRGPSGRRMPTWQVQTAKAKFSELFRKARTEGPQVITRQNQEAVVILPLEQFDQLMARAGQPRSLVEFFRSSPFVGLEMEFERAPAPARVIDLHN